MKEPKSRPHYFTRAEILLWASSAFFILLSFLLFDRENILTLAASLLGTTSLIFNAKANPAGQVLMVIFSVFYGVISFSFAYYGEMATYLGMTAPMSVFALISWLKNPYKSKRSEVRINRLKRGEIVFMAFLTSAVTVCFYFILKFFHTENLLLSTVSVSTSFAAVYLTFRRSSFYAALYALNDLVLIGLWTLATLRDPSYCSLIVCFLMFLFNDIYGFVNWQRMHRRQTEN